MKHLYALVALLFCLSITQTALAKKITMFPAAISSECREGKAKIYDECSNQLTILNAAKQSAAESGKSVLVVYGAEWCIWCHVFDKYIAGESRKFRYEWVSGDELNRWLMRERENKKAEQEAKMLNEYVADNFVVAHIEGDYSPNGSEALAATGYDNGISYVPFIMAINASGEYIGHMPPISQIDGLEIRQDSGNEYRGYNRLILIEQLKKLRAAALK